MTDEYIRKEDALDAISCDITITGKENAEIVCKAIASFADGIKALEPADVVPVVRCKDCKHWSRENYSYCFVHACYGMASDDFCSYGERKEKHEID